MRVAGLARFSQTNEVDPWTNKVQMILCARFEGGTKMYFSPEQHGLWASLDKKRRDEVERIKAEKPLTAATSDLFQVALTVLEVHARQKLPGDAEAQGRMLEGCLRRTPAADVAKLSPLELEVWLVSDLGLRRLEGKVASKGVGGARMVKLCMTVDVSTARKLVKEELGLTTGASIELTRQFLANVSTP